MSATIVTPAQTPPSCPLGSGCQGASPPGPPIRFVHGKDGDVDGFGPVDGHALGAGGPQESLAASSALEHQQDFVGGVDVLLAWSVGLVTWHPMPIVPQRDVEALPQIAIRHLLPITLTCVGLTARPPWGGLAG